MTRIIIFFIIIFCVISSAYADGGHFSSSEIHLHSPNQKAVIHWDGQKETMILSSAVKSENMANFAWVIPIQSYTKPEVAEGDISIFEELVKYFGYYDKNFQVFESGMDGKGNLDKVQVLETKEVNVFDITILKATDSAELITWLNQNGYKIPQNAKEIFDKYVSRKDSYFIANKIDLKNIHSRALDFIENFKSNREKSPKSYTAIDARTISDYSIENATQNLAYDILTNSSFDDARKTHGSNFAFFSKEDYENLKGVYELPFDKEIHPDLKWVLHSIVRSAQTATSVGVYCLREPKYFRDKIFLYGSPDSEYTFSMGRGEDLIERFGSLEFIKHSLNIIPFDELKKRINSVESKVKEIIETEMEPVLNMVPEIKKLINDGDNLKMGIGTPLKFEFRPNRSYYPLEISSLNAGQTFVEIYVISEYPVRDINKILKVDKSKEIDAQFAEKLEKYFNLDKTDYVTRLSYRGDSLGFTTDAVFEH